MIKIRSTMLAVIAVAFAAIASMANTAQAQTYNQLKKTDWRVDCLENGRLVIDWEDRNKIAYKFEAGGPVVPRGTNKVYCSVKCPATTESTLIRNKLHKCVATAELCQGTEDKLPNGWDERHDQNDHFYPDGDGTVYFGETDCWVKKDYDAGDKVRCMPNWLGNPRPHNQNKKCYWYEGGV